MKRHKIFLKDLRTNLYGFSSIAEFHSNLNLVARLISDADDIVDVDMSGVRWLDAHLAAPLLLIVRFFQNQVPAKIQYTNIDPTVRAILQKNGFFAERRFDNHNTTIPITEFGLGAEIAQSFSFNRIAQGAGRINPIDSINEFQCPPRTFWRVFPAKRITLKAKKGPPEGGLEKSKYWGFIYLVAPNSEQQ